MKFMVKRSERMSVAIWVVAFVVNLIWASTYVSTQILLRTFSPFEISLIRYSIAWGVLWIVRPTMCDVKSSREHLVMMGMGGVGIVCYQVLENCAIESLHASSAGILMSLGPLFSACALGMIAGGRRMSRLFGIGTLLACFGAAMACANAGSLVGMRFTLEGTLFAFGAMACWCAYTVGSDYLASKGYGAIYIVRGTFFWAVLLSFGVASLKCVSYDGGSLSGSVSQALLLMSDGIAILNVAVLGVGASAICYVLWEWIGIKGGYSHAVVVLYLSPICTVCVSSLVLKDPVSGGEWAGAALSVIGVLIALKSDRVILQQHPEKYPNLQVRVCGWNVRWNDLCKAEQDAYIRRAEGVQ